MFVFRSLSLNILFLYRIYFNNGHVNYVFTHMKRVEILLFIVLPKIFHSIKLHEMKQTSFRFFHRQAISVFINIILYILFFRDSTVRCVYLQDSYL